MKKPILIKYGQLTSLFILFTSNLYSQTNDFNYGLKGGVDYFNYPVEETYNRLEIENDLGYFVGVYGQIYLQGKLSLQPELILRRHNAVEKISDVTFQTPNGIFLQSIYPSKVRVSDYIIQLPLKMKYELVSNLEISLGPQFSYIISRKFEATENSLGIASEEIAKSEVFSDIEYDAFDFGISLGVNYRLNSKLGVFIDYTAGLIERDSKIKTSIIDLGISWKLK